MILSGKEIEKHLGKEIVIEPYDPSRLNPNSYNLSLANELLVYENELLDMKTPNPTRHLTIPEEGLVLEPGKLYLGRTNEFTRTDGFVPMLEGRSSTGRLGLFIHVTAGLATWALPATGRSRSSASSPSASIPTSRSVRSTITISTANMSPIGAANIKIIWASSPACSTRTSKNNRRHSAGGKGGNPLWQLVKAFRV